MERATGDNLRGGRHIAFQHDPARSAVAETNTTAWVVAAVIAFVTTGLLAMALSNPLHGARRPAHVGRPLPGVEVRLVDDAGAPASAGEPGEIEVRGPGVFREYWRRPGETRAAFHDGWFRTGDIGRLDRDGFLFIAGRRKEIINRGGKKIAPQPIETALKLDKYISQAFVYGDRKPYLTALLVPNMERLKEHAREMVIDYIDVSGLVTHEQVRKLYEQRVAEIKNFADFAAADFF
jgi:long-subunit acyl-CoA synthetase (AMP-forming)